MKKHLYTNIFILGLAVFIAQTAYAQETGTVVTPKRPVKEVNQVIRADRKEMNAGIKADRKAMASSTASTTPAMKKEFREETRDTRQDFRKDARDQRQDVRVASKVKIVTNRLNATITRLEKIVAKLDTRIEKFKEKGVDVTVATTASAEAKAALASAKEKIATIAVPVDTDTTDASSVTGTIKTTVKAVEQDLKVARDAVEKALKSFKGQSGTSTTTPTN